MDLTVAGKSTSTPLGSGSSPAACADWAAGRASSWSAGPLRGPGRAVIESPRAPGSASATSVPFVGEPAALAGDRACVPASCPGDWAAEETPLEEDIFGAGPALEVTAITRRAPGMAGPPSFPEVPPRPDTTRRSRPGG